MKMPLYKANCVLAIILSSYIYSPVTYAWCQVIDLNTPWTTCSTLEEAWDLCWNGRFPEAVAKQFPEELIYSCKAEYYGVNRYSYSNDYAGTNYLAPSCNGSGHFDPITKQCVNTLVDKNKNSGPPNCQLKAGNPINIGSGNKYQHETDLSAANGSLLHLDRHYNYHSFYFTKYRQNGEGSFIPAFGFGWTHSYSQTLNPNAAYVSYTLANGQTFNFYHVSTGEWLADKDINYRLQEIVPLGGGASTWKITTSDGDVESYNAVGDLLSITHRHGLVETLVYTTDTTTSSTAPFVGLLLSVTDSFNNTLSFTYTSAGRIATMADPAGKVTRYDYDLSDNLTTVIYPDATPADASDNPKKTYLYNELANTSNSTQTHALTGIIDENGGRFATFQYDAQNRGISTQHAGGAERVSVAYGNNNVVVTDTLGTSRTINLQTILGIVKSGGSDQPAGSGCAAASSSISHDANGNVASRTDFKGNRTNYNYDLTSNLEINRTEGLTSTGANTPQTRTISTVWHASFRLPVKITEPGKETS